MKHLNKYENFNQNKINEGLISWAIGGFIILKLIKFIIRILQSRKAYKILVSNILTTTWMNAQMKFGTIDDNGDKSKATDALQVAEYEDRYFLTFPILKGPLKTLRVMKK
jgi:hypothetical protein